MRKEAKNVPKIMAKKVKEVINPFALEIFSEETNSGTIPYLDGPNIALCVASKNKIVYEPHLLSNAKVQTASPMMMSSKIFVRTIMSRLLNRSAIVPEIAEKSKK